jgi:signal transduction histidine kinase
MEAAPNTGLDETLLVQRVTELEGQLDLLTRALSHDLRTPLATTIGFAELLMQERAGALNPQQREYLSDVFNGSRRLLRQMDELIRFTRLCNQPIQLERVDVTTLVAEVMNEVLDADRQHSLAIHIGRLPDVDADRGQLRQMFAQLFANACKFTRHTTNAAVDVQGRESGADVVYTISDNGAGFDMKQADRLFHLFKRLHRDDQFEGTGAGLAFVRQVVERHGGRIAAEAAVGKGACFTVTLPSHAGTPRSGIARAL